MKNQFYALMLVVCVLFVHSKGEVFTATSDLVKMAEVYSELIAHLDDYLTKRRGDVEEERKVAKVSELLRRMVEVRDKLGTESFVGNPVNAYLLIKRMAIDWQQVEHLMDPIADRRWRRFWATDGEDVEDLEGAATGLLRLQDTYNLSTSTLAKGIIPFLKKPQDMNLGPDSGAYLQMTAKECVELAIHSYVKGNNYLADLWMREAEDRVNGQMDEESEECLLLLASLAHRVGHLRRALSFIEKLLQMNPSHILGKVKKKNLEQLIEASGEGLDTVLTKPIKSADQDIYEKLCRGEKMLKPREEAHLTCYYLNTRNKPYMRYTHIKVEEVSKNASLMIIHQIMSDREMNAIKLLSQPYLERSFDGLDADGNDATPEFRISKTNWLGDDADETVARISKRIGYITELSLSTAEELQVLNYGIGGYYAAHFDATPEGELLSYLDIRNGLRIATWMNYMSDVKAGGATVFPKLGVGIWPQQGSAVFWWNLDEAGNRDLSTFHAGCPVLWGSKWVSNKWFRERGQEFTRPCPLQLPD